MFKMLFNLLLLAAVAYGAFHVYVEVTGDHELMAEFLNAKDQMLLQLEEEWMRLKEELQRQKEELDDMKRSVGL